MTIIINNKAQKLQTGARKMLESFSTLSFTSCNFFFKLRTQLCVASSSKICIQGYSIFSFFSFSQVPQWFFTFQWNDISPQKFRKSAFLCLQKCSCVVIHVPTGEEEDDLKRESEGFRLRLHLWKWLGGGVIVEHKDDCSPSVRGVP